MTSAPAKMTEVKRNIELPECNVKNSTWDTATSRSDGQAGTPRAGPTLDWCATGRRANAGAALGS